MDDTSLIKLAIAMHKQQRSYHRGKATSDLIEAKKLERQFDLEIERRQFAEEKTRSNA